MSESEYNLAKSKKALGPLYPILKAKDGSIIDGFHRQNDDPDWASITVESIDTPVKLELARLAANFCRRQMPATEFQNRIAFLIKSGLKVSEIAEQTGISETTIRKYEPQELKDQVKVEAGRQGGISATQARQTVKIQDTVQCDRCHVSTSSPVEWHNHKLCESCHSKAETDPDGFNGYFAAVSKKPEPHTVLTTDSPRALDTWEVRKAQMSVQHSKEEENIIRGLRAKGYNVETDLDICLMKTTPDFNICLLNGKWVRGYIDGVQVHSGKQSDRDDELRGLLRKRHPEDIVVEVRVKGDSDKETEAKLAEIEEAMKF